MQVRHQSHNKEITVSCSKAAPEQPDSSYILHMWAAKGRGGSTEPNVWIFMDAREVRDFAVDLLSLVAVEESRV